MTERRYISETEAAEYIGVCARSFRNLPIPVCRPNRRKLYDVRDLDKYMQEVKCPPFTSAEPRRVRRRKRSAQISGSTGGSFLARLESERVERLNARRSASKKSCEKVSPSNTSP